jgi:hypothetical protein
VLISAWQDSAIVRFATTIHTGKEWPIQERKKPKGTSTSAAITKVLFEAFSSDPTLKKAAKPGRRCKEYVHRQLLPIPGMVDDYNHFMNGVDVADQLWAKFTTEQRTHRSWLPLFYFCLDTAIINAYILYMAYWNPSITAKKKIRGTHRTFRENLVEGLLLQYRPVLVRIYRSPRNLPVSRLDRPLKIHQKVQGIPGKCLFCRFSKEMCQVRLGHTGEAGNSIKVRSTRTTCNHCGIYLCAGCFSLFHNFKSIA